MSMIAFGYKHDVLYTTISRYIICFRQSHSQNLDGAMAVIAWSFSSDAFVPLYRFFIRLVKSPSRLALICKRPVVGTLNSRVGGRRDVRC